MKIRDVVLCLLLGVGQVLVGCGSGPSESERIEREKNQLLEKADVVYQVGCDLDGSCRRDAVVCGEEAREGAVDALRAGDSVVVRYIDVHTVVTTRDVWSLSSTDSGTRYWREVSDVSGGCDGYCGWHAEEVGPADLTDDGRLELRGSPGEKTVGELVYDPGSCERGEAARESDG